jgi:putative transcriptional regulator
VKNDVARLRAKAGLTQADLASLVGVSRQTIHSIEKGRHTPGLVLAFAIADALDVDVEAVFDVRGAGGHSPG